MGDTFSGITLALRGIYSSQKALDITNSNITNTASEGYVRRKAAFKAVAINGTMGVTTESVRMRDSYLDFKVWNQTSASNEWSTKATYYDQLMNIIDEPSDMSLNGVTNEFFSSFQELSKTPSSIALRNTVLQKSEQFTDFLNTMANELENYQYDLNEQAKVQTEAINNLSKEIADLNMNIYNTEISGGDASFQHDQLELKIKELSEYGDVSVSETVYGKLINGSEDKRTTIMFGGVVLIDHSMARELVCVKTVPKINPEDIDGLYKITTKEGTALDLSSGKLKATLEVRDGTGENGEWVKGIPYYIRELNKFTQKFAKAFNEGIVDYDNDGNINVTTTDDPNNEKKKGYVDGYLFGSDAAATEPAKLRFFTNDGVSSAKFVEGINDPDDLNEINGLYSGITAKNISLSADVKDNIDNIFSSFNSTSNKNDTDSILSLINFREDNKMFGTGDVDNYIEGMITNIGLDASSAKTKNTAQTALLEELVNRRAQYSDVSLDEELAYLVQYQQLYNASAKTLSTYQEIFDTLLGAI